MIDKISTIPKSKLGHRIGRIGDDDFLRLNRGILVFLGLAVSPGARTNDLLKYGVSFELVCKPLPLL